MHTNRLSRLIEQIGAHGFDALALVPGPNLFYLTSLSFHLSERPVVALFPVDAPPAIVLPALEAAKVEQAAVGLDVFPYSDEEGHTPAFQSACAALELAGCIIGVEALRMRLLEVRLLERYGPGCRLVPAEEVMAELRICKDMHELEQMRRAIAITEAALRSTMRQVKAGMTERKVATLLTIEMLLAGKGWPSRPSSWPALTVPPPTPLPPTAPSSRARPSSWTAARPWAAMQPTSRAPSPSAR